jgi:ribosomal protein S18 acetylase RimI-like enzyme
MQQHEPWAMRMNDPGESEDRVVIVRRYEVGDRDAVHRIAADTAFFGEPIEIYLDDRSPFQDLFVAYYTDSEPDHAWVAEADGQVVGYLTGCPDSARFERILRRRILPSVLMRALRGHYGLGRKTWRYSVRLALSWLRGESPQIDHSLYPAHLHISVAESWRGCGAGRGMMAAYLDQLRMERVVGVHLQTTTLNRAALGLYRSAGFKLLSAHLSRMWEGIIPEPVENLAFGLPLTSASE